MLVTRTLTTTRLAAQASRPCAVPQAAASRPSRGQVGRRQQCSWAPQQHLRSLMVCAAAADEAEPMPEPENAKEAITLGLQLTGAGRWADAIPVFEKVGTLPGTGIKRFRDKPRQASDSEKMTALYNMACCYSQLNDTRSGLLALASALELGYADFSQIRRDEDLAALRSDERFEGLMRRFEPQQLSLGGLFGLFGGNK